MLKVLLSTGARCSEMLGITWADISFERSVVLIRGLKGSNDREIPIDAALMRRIFDFQALTTRDSGRDRAGLASARVFEVSYSRLKAIWYWARPAHKKLHSLRHTFAIQQLKRHGRLDVIRRLLGHRSIQNTMIYADYAFTESEFRALVLGGPAPRSPNK